MTLTLLQYTGAPADGDHAVATLDAATSQGIDFLILIWPALGWLNYDQPMAQPLNNQHTPVSRRPDAALYQFHRPACNPKQAAGDRSKSEVA